MRYVITHLKAPWPLGAVAGDVLELAEVPVWAVGKCKPAEDAEPTISTGDGSGVPLLPVDDDAAQAAAALAEAEAQADTERAALQEKAATKGKAK